MAKPKNPEVKSTYPSMAALAEELGMCERSTRDAVRRNEIPHIRIGKRYILPRAAIADWLRTAGQGAGVASGIR
jgi:excisionase family DNA binding protein